MIFDRTLLFSNAQAVVATAASTDIVDLGATGTAYGHAAALIRDIGKGAEVPINIQIVEAFNTLTSLAIAVQVADDAAFSTNLTTVWTRTYLLAELTVGKVANLDDIPLGSRRRYMRLYYTVTGTAPTLGKVTAGVVAGQQTNGIDF